MKINFDDLNSVNFNEQFDAYFKDIITTNDYDIKNEFFGVAGKQHYRLLAYLSTLCDNSTIIDIGSHRGSSACALSFNQTNQIISFDIINNVVNPKIRERKNIKFVLDNLFDDYDKYKELIMSCPLIVLDIDPHEGNMEYDFYLKLKEWGYKGILFCDDIWHFEGMRNNFWYKIEDQYKYDVTDVGHWSGSCIISFQPIDLPKNLCDNWTLVTAYFNLAKCPDASKEIKERDQEYYMKHAYSTLSLPYNLVIYCDEESYEKLRALRPEYLKDRTTYVIREFDELAFEGYELKFKEYREVIKDNRIKNPYHFDNRNTASYYLFCMARYIMLKESIKNNVFGSTHFAWINICIQRMGINNVKRLPEALSINRDKFSTTYIDYIPHSLILNTKEYYKFGRCSMCSGFFTGNAYYMDKVCGLIIDKFVYYLKLECGHADEQLFSPCYFENKELFEHYYGDYQEMITNYVYAYDNPEKIIQIFINSAYQHKDYEKCLEACEFVLKSLREKKCVLNDLQLMMLNNFYHACKKLI